MTKTMKLASAVLSAALACVYLTVGCTEEATPTTEVGSTGGAGGGGGAGGDSSACSSNAASEECHLERDATCAKLSEESCSSIDYCWALTARRIDSDLMCVEGPSEYVGCGAVGCCGALTRATDPSGALWLFTSTCLPQGWTYVSLSSADECGAGGAAGAPSN